MARYPQIKALVWFPYHDSGPADPPPDNGGVYSGLVTTTGAFKLSWFAFSGGNKLTIKATALSGASKRLAGAAHVGRHGRAQGKTLVLYRKTAGHPWRFMRNLTTGARGAYHTAVKVSGRTYFKVAWLGVVQQPGAVGNVAGAQTPMAGIDPRSTRSGIAPKHAWICPAVRAMSGLVVGSANPAGAAC